jgi:hypothetical protein
MPAVHVSGGASFHEQHDLPLAMLALLPPQELKAKGVGEAAIKAALEAVFGPGGRLQPDAGTWEEEDEGEDSGAKEAAGGASGGLGWGCGFDSNRGRTRWQSQARAP